MAEVLKSPTKPENLSGLEGDLDRDFNEDLRSHDDAISEFDKYEAMHMSKVFDSTSKKTKNGITDSATSTIYLERAARVAAQLPTGDVQAYGRKDRGKGWFMKLVLEKWIFPHANAQRKLKTKFFLWQYGSSEYGYMPMYYDINVTPDGYFGPDCWLWNPRNAIPQSGLTNVSEMDYMHLLAFKSPSYLEDLLEDPNSNYDLEAIKSVMVQVKNATRQPDQNRDTKVFRERQKQPVRQVCIATRYESGKDGHWITFLPDFGCKVIRDIPNPHKNGRIPIVIKPCIPDFSSFYNIGDFQRSEPMQAVSDGLKNFYFEGIKINLRPILMVNGQTIVRQTMDLSPDSVWEFQGQPDAKRLETSTAGLSTFQAAHGMAQGALQSIAGTTNTQPNAENASDPGFSKTPEGLKMIQQRESTRDGQDRDFLEEAIAELIEGWMSIIPTVADKIPVDLLAKEIQDVAKAGYTDILELFRDVPNEMGGAPKTELNPDSKLVKGGLVSSGRVSTSQQQARLHLNPAAFKGLTYKFQIVSGSTSKKTKEEQLQSLLDFFKFVGTMPNVLQDYKEQTGETLNLKNFFAQFGLLADIPGMDNMFTSAQSPPPMEMAGSAGTPADLGGAPPPDGGGMPPDAGGGQPPTPIATPAGAVMPTPGAPGPLAPPAPPGGTPGQPPKQILNYKDAPEDVRRQMEAADGYIPSTAPAPAANPPGSPPPAAPTAPAGAPAPAPAPAMAGHPLVVGGIRYTDPRTAQMARHLLSLGG